MCLIIKTFFSFSIWVHQENRALDFTICIEVSWYVTQTYLLRKLCICVFFNFIKDRHTFCFCFSKAFHAHIPIPINPYLNTNPKKSHDYFNNQQKKTSPRLVVVNLWYLFKDFDRWIFTIFEKCMWIW